VDERYLWDRTGPPDAEVVRLERVLSTLRSKPAAPRWSELTPHRPGAPLAFFAAAAVLVLACAGGLWSIARAVPDSWPVVRVAGVPVVGARPVDDAGHLGVGQWLETDARSRATLAVSDIGRLDVDPGTRLQLVSTRAGRHRLLLPRGTVHALIWAPPGQFVVDTPSSTAVDLGCAYTLHVDVNGAGVIEVTAGWVAFEKDGRDALIPAGARCDTRPRTGPGTPYYADADPALRDALAAIDAGGARDADRRAALDRAIARARPRDALTLWHLLARVPADDRGRVFDALARLVPPPGSVTRAGIVAGNQPMQNDWWDALGLGTTAWWREWIQSWP
jgi:hypothetical protein